MVVKKEEIYSSKITEIANEVDFGAFTNYNWWKQVKAHVEPLLNSLEANIAVSLAMRDEQVGRSKSVHRLVPIDKTHCLVLSHTKQFENKVGDAVFNTAYLYKCDWASIMAQFANRGKEGKYLINLTCQAIFKRYGRGRTYLLRKESSFDGKCGVKAIKELIKNLGGEIPINGREYWDFILPCRKEALSSFFKGGDKIEQSIKA